MSVSRAGSRDPDPAVRAGKDVSQGRESENPAGPETQAVDGYWPVGWTAPISGRSGRYSFRPGCRDPDPCLTLAQRGDRPGDAALPRLRCFRIVDPGRRLAVKPERGTESHKRAPLSLPVARAFSLRAHPPNLARFVIPTISRGPTHWRLTWWLARPSCHAARTYPRRQSVLLTGLLDAASTSLSSLSSRDCHGGARVRLSSSRAKACPERSAAESNGSRDPGTHPFPAEALVQPDNERWTEHSA